MEAASCQENLEHAVTDPKRINLTGDQALVLLEFVSRFSETNVLRFEDDAEKIVLWHLTAKLEGAVAGLSTERYLHLVSAAQRRLRERSNAF